MALTERRADLDEVARTRSDRISSRVKPEQKERFEYAAALEGETLTEFLLRSAEDRAQRVLQEHEALRLRGSANARFVELLTNAPAPNDALRAAFERHTNEVESP